MEIRIQATEDFVWLPILLPLAVIGAVAVAVVALVLIKKRRSRRGGTTKLPEQVR